MSTANTIAALTLLATTFGAAQDANADCPPKPQEREAPGLMSIFGNIAEGIAGGVVRDATRGLGNQAGRAVRDASGEYSKYTREAQSEVRKGVNETTRGATNAAKEGTRRILSPDCP